MEQATKIPSENLIEAKEILGNTAVNQLQQGEDYNNLAHTEVVFGYIYLRDDKFESLFKVVTDLKTLHFAAQKGQLMRLQDSFSNEMFEATSQQMISFHGEWF